MSGAELVRLFERSARPDRGFSWDAAGKRQFVSYAELLDEARLLADKLAGLKFRKRFIAAIWMEPSPACYRAFMAIVLANGIPVPLHGYSPAAEVAAVLDKLEAEALLYSPALLEGGGGAILLRLEGDGVCLLPAEGSAWTPPVDAVRRRTRTYAPPEETAVIFMSSGSTGTPKGIMLSAGNLLANMASIQASLHLNEGDTVLISKSFGYSSTVTGEWLLALQVGMNVDLARGLAHPLRLIAEIKRSQATFLCTVPSALLPIAKSSAWREEELGSLRKLIVVGAAMPAEPLLKLQRRLPRADIMPCYGQTEASPRITCLPAGLLARKPGSAGMAVPGVELTIVREGRPARRGEEGEIVVRGPNVMLGYYDDAERTASALTPMGLRTQDLGRLDEDGCLYVTGRLDNAFNVAGHLFHPEKLENALLAHPLVREAAVAGVPDDVLGSRPVALVVPAANALDDEDELIMQLHRHCRDRFAAAGRPKDIWFVGALPRTRTGKPDRAAILSMAKERYYDFGNRTNAPGADGH